VRTAAVVLRAIGDPLRLHLLQELMHGPATVSDLAQRTRQPQSNASNHLAVLRGSGMVISRRRGRLVEYQIADTAVAQLVEAISLLTGPARTGLAAELAEGRTCYDHLAGRLGVTLLDRLIAAGALVHVDEPAARTLALGPNADAVFARLGLDLAGLDVQRRRFAYACLDWTERRPHLGGALGAALAARFLAAGWVRRRAGGRGLHVGAAAWNVLTPRNGAPQESS
jgi:DNA-binding transcriptional ArsR family regulator